MAKENQRVAVSKRMLKEGVLLLLEKKNIEQINVSELCEASGINRTTFYRHYQTPHDVLLEIEMDFIKDIYEIPIPSGDLNHLKGYASDLCRHIYDHREKVKLFIRNNTDADFLLQFQKFSDRFITSKQILYKGQPTMPATQQLMQTFFSYGSYAMVKQWLVEELPFSPDDIAEIILSAFSRDLSLG